MSVVACCGIEGRVQEKAGATGSRARYSSLRWLGYLLPFSYSLRELLGEHSAHQIQALGKKGIYFRWLPSAGLGEIRAATAVSADDRSDCLDDFSSVDAVDEFFTD